MDPVSHVCENSCHSSCEFRFEQRVSRVKTITFHRNHPSSFLLFVLLSLALQFDTNHSVPARLATPLVTAITSTLGRAAQQLRAWFHSWDL